MKKTYLNIVNIFFCKRKKIKSCKRLLDITWLTLLVQKQLIQGIKINID
jgi:hypothetical protein